jgi:hypothetical protein
MATAILMEPMVPAVIMVELRVDTQKRGTLTQPKTHMTHKTKH